MKRGSVLPIIGLVILAVVVGAAVLFAFPYNPTHPPRANATNSSPEGIKAVVNDSNQFAVKMYHQLENQTGNVFFSPYSIYSAMAVVYEGAGGRTAWQMKNAMPFPNRTLLEPNFAAVYNEINNASSDYILRTGNALWIQKGFPIKEDYKARVEDYYGAKAALVDFVNEPEKSRQVINEFISNQTNGKIPEIIPKNVITSLTRLIITNAIYFKGTWKYKFDKNETREANFYVTPDNPVKVQMMHMYPEHRDFNYADLGFAQVLELPYRGNLSMIIILPNKTNSSIQDVEGRLTLPSLDSWLSKMHKMHYISIIAIPKFEFHTGYALSGYMKKMGITDLFDPTSANLYGISDRGLSVTKVLHKAYVKVDEEGTEAAAATAVVIGITAVNPNSMVKFVADHPFIFLIRDNNTGAILFMGRITNPATS